MSISRRMHAVWALVTSMAVVAGGCNPTQPFYFFEDGNMSHWKGVATEVEYPDVDAASLAEVEGALEPLTLSNSDAREIWELPLEEAMQHALANSKVLRSLGGFTAGLPVVNQNISPTGQLLNAPGGTPTVYNPAVIESDPRLGTEGALSEFDAQLSSSIFWEKNDRPVNLFFRGFLSPVLEQDTSTFQAQIVKRTTSGSQLAVRQNTSYEWNNNPSNRFPSAYNVDIEGEFRHPLLQGGGTVFNRIAGPNGTPGNFNGIVLARINTDIALADFEAGVRNFVSDVERSYWDLYFNYRNLDAVLAGRDSALATWRKVYTLYMFGAKQGDAAAEAQAREQYFLFRAQVETALSSLYTAENRLRYMMGLAATDGRLIRPTDEPTTAKVQFDWHEILPESLTRSVEVRRQKWQIKQRELQLTASRNFLLPRLDVVGRYRWRGFGDELISANQSDVQFTNAWQELTGGEFQEWQTGVQFSMPFGFRQELAGVKNAELLLARERAILHDQELELTHQLTNAVRDLDRSYVLSQTNFNRRAAAEKQVSAYEALVEVNVATVDLLLDAQRRLADAEIAYFRSLVDYNLGVLQVHFRKNSLLEYNGIYLAEGPWPAKAYFDARKRARERDAAMFLDYGFTRPEVFSRGPFPQHQSGAPMFDMGVNDVTEESQGELVPTPAPTLAEPEPESAGAKAPNKDEADDSFPMPDEGPDANSEDSPNDAAPEPEGDSASGPWTDGPDLESQATFRVKRGAANAGSAQRRLSSSGIQRVNHDALPPRTRQSARVVTPRVTSDESGWRTMTR